MKKIINKNTVLGLIVGIIISGVGVYAANYAANTIDYTTSKNNNVKTVKDALDDLYNNRQFEIYDMIEKTTISSNPGYNLTKVTLKNNKTDKIMYIKIEGDVVIQDKNDTYIIDLKDFDISNILNWNIYSYNNQGDFRVVNSDFTKDSISIKCDTNYGSATKYDYNYLITVIYN